MVFQVVTPAKLREAQGRQSVPAVHPTVGNGRVTPTATQRADRPDMGGDPRSHRVRPGRITQEGGGLSNVATVIGAPHEEQRLGAAALASVAAIYPEVVAQRVGYLIDLMATEVGAEFDTEETPGTHREGRPLPKVRPPTAATEITTNAGT